MIAEPLVPKINTISLTPNTHAVFYQLIFGVKQLILVALTTFFNNGMFNR